MTLDNVGATQSQLRPLPAELTGARVRTALSGVAIVALAGLTAACGSGGAASGYAGQPAGARSQPAATHGHVVAARNLAGVGTVLIDQSGKTIYSPEQEAHGKIRCTASCLSFWFPVAVRRGTPLRAPHGVRGVLGTIHRKDDGITQLTFDGRPLYTFRLDQSPGQVHGNNFNDSFGGTSFTWQVVAASGATSHAKQPAKSGGYSYPASGAYG